MLNSSMRPLWIVSMTFLELNYFFLALGFELIAYATLDATNAEIAVPIKSFFFITKSPFYLSYGFG